MESAIRFGLPAHGVGIGVGVGVGEAGGDGVGVGPSVITRKKVSTRQPAEGIAWSVAMRNRSLAKGVSMRGKRLGDDVPPESHYRPFARNGTLEAVLMVEL